MNMEVDRRLKDLYMKLERGRSITLNDLVFLSEYDRECYVRTYRNLVLDGAEELETPKKEFVPSSGAGMITMTVQQHVDEIIDILRKAGVGADLVQQVSAKDVMELIEEKAAEPMVEKDRYEYFNSYEPMRYLNAKA